MDLICFSHLRWNPLYQRPQQLLMRFAKDYRIFYIEEADYRPGAETPQLEHDHAAENILVIRPLLPEGTSEKESVCLLQLLLVEMFEAFSIHPDIFWYYTPMALMFTKGFTPELTVYDCMDEMTSVKLAPSVMSMMEKQLFRTADMVFTGGIKNEIAQAPVLLTA